MAYSTVSQIRENEYILEVAQSPDLTNDVILHRIEFADALVEQDLSRMVSFPLAGDAPSYINLLSQYKATELCLVWLYTRKRQGKESDDVQYWSDAYDTLLQRIYDGKVELGEDGTGTTAFGTVARSGVEPALGVGKYGGFLTDEELEKIRPRD